MKRSPRFSAALRDPTAPRSRSLLSQLSQTRSLAQVGLWLFTDPGLEGGWKGGGGGGGIFYGVQSPKVPFTTAKDPERPVVTRNAPGPFTRRRGGEDKRGVGQAGPGGTPRNLRGRWKDARPETSAQQLFSPSLEPCWGKLPATLTARMPSRAVLPRAVPCRASAPLPALAVPQPHRPSGLDPGGRTSRRPSTAIRRRRSHSGWGGAGRPGAPPVLPCFALPCSAWPCYPANIPAPWIAVPMHAVFRSCKLSSFFPCVRVSFPTGCHPFCPTRIPGDAFLLPAQGSSCNLNFSTLSWRC